jgi:hypothetical protein
VGRQSALHKENSEFAAPTLGRHISTFRGYQILFSIQSPYINCFTNHFYIHSQPFYPQKVVLHSITARFFLRPYHFAIWLSFEQTSKLLKTKRTFIFSCLSVSGFILSLYLLILTTIFVCIWFHFVSLSWFWQLYLSIWFHFVSLSWFWLLYLSVFSFILSLYLLILTTIFVCIWFHFVSLSFDFDYYICLYLVSFCLSIFWFWLLYLSVSGFILSLYLLILATIFVPFCVFFFCFYFTQFIVGKG